MSWLQADQIGFERIEMLEDVFLNGGFGRRLGGVFARVTQDKNG